MPFQTFVYFSPQVKQVLGRACLQWENCEALTNAVKRLEIIQWPPVFPPHVIVVLRVVLVLIIPVRVEGNLWISIVIVTLIIIGVVVSEVVRPVVRVRIAIVVSLEGVVLGVRVEALKESGLEEQRKRHEQNKQRERAAKPHCASCKQTMQKCKSGLKAERSKAKQNKKGKKLFLIKILNSRPSAPLDPVDLAILFFFLFRLHETERRQNASTQVICC
jgi:hypothetical protein